MFLGLWKSLDAFELSIPFWEGLFWAIVAGIGACLIVASAEEELDEEEDGKKKN